MSARIRWTCLTLTGLACLASYFVQPAAAQFSSGSTGSSAFGSRSLGGSTSSNRTGRSTGASNALTGGQTGGQGGTGTASGALGTGAPASGERYLRGNQGAFVGADSSDGALNSYTAQAGAAGGLGGAAGNQMMMQAFRQNQQRNQGQNANQQNNKLTVRTPFRIDSIKAPVLGTTFTSRMTTRYANLPALKGKGNIAMVMEGDTLVLQGQVQSAADRKLAEDLLSLEPGVNLVRNELLVAQPGSTPTSFPAAASEELSAPRNVSQPLER